jgi:hypothetical protein
MNQTLEEFRAQMKRELALAANEDLKTEVQRVQKARGCSFDEAWRRTEREEPGLFRVGAIAGSSSESESPQSYLDVEARAQRLIYQSGGTMTMSEAIRRARGGVVNASDNPGTPKDPRVVQELAKHKRLGDAQRSDLVDDHVDRHAQIRKLMTEKNLTFDTAFGMVCQQESAAKTTPATASVLGHVAPPAEPEPEELVEAEDEQERAPHPGQAAAIAKGWQLIEGGFFTPLHGKE